MAQLLVDVIVVFAYFLCIVSIGLRQRNKSRSVKGFALGDRNIVWWAVLGSIIAAEISAATFLGAPAEGFEKRNFSYAQLAIGTILARIFVSFAFIPLFYRRGVVSVYEFLETRFGPRTRTFASGTFLITRVLAMGTRLYVSAIVVVLAYEMVTGPRPSPLTEFWLFSAALVLITILTALYTTAGGIQAVVWTDCFQVGVLLAAVGFSIWFLTTKISQPWAAVANHLQHPVFWNLGEPKGTGLHGWVVGILGDEYTIWTAFIGSTFVTMATHGIDQDTVQRMLTAKNQKQSALATILSGICDLPIAVAFIFIGILLSVYYSTSSDPNVPIESRNIFPYFILHTMPEGLRGLVIAGILAATMGSLSTALNALATSFSVDFVIRLAKEDLTDRDRVRILRWSTVFFALVIVAVGIVTAWYACYNPSMRIIPLVLGIIGYTFGSLLGIFLIGIFTQSRGNDIGNIVAMIAGFLSVAYLSGVDLVLLDILLPSPLGPRRRDLIIAFPWRVTIGCIVTALVASCFPSDTKRSGAQKNTAGAAQDYSARDLS